MAFYRKQTPSAPDWFRAIDHVVGVLLAIEIDRMKSDRASEPKHCERCGTNYAQANCPQCDPDN